MLLVFSLDNRQSFTNLETWSKELLGRMDLVLVLIGSKKDKVQRTVTYKEAQLWAEDRNMSYYETSAK